MIKNLKFLKIHTELCSKRTINNDWQPFWQKLTRHPFHYAVPIPSKSSKSFRDFHENHFRSKIIDLFRSIAKFERSFYSKKFKKIPSSKENDETIGMLGGREIIFRSFFRSGLIRRISVRGRTCRYTIGHI